MFYRIIKEIFRTFFSAMNRLLKRTTLLLCNRLSWVLLFQDKLVVECFSQLKVFNKALAIRERMPALGESGWWEDISRLQMVASEWTLKKSLLQAWGLVLRANTLEDVNPGNVLWSLAS